MPDTALSGIAADEAAAQLELSLTIINQSASITSGEMNAVNIPEICLNTLSSKNDSRNFRFRNF